MSKCVACGTTEGTELAFVGVDPPEESYVGARQSLWACKTCWEHRREDLRLFARSKAGVLAASELPIRSIATLLRPSRFDYLHYWEVMGKPKFGRISCRPLTKGDEILILESTKVILCSLLQAPNNSVLVSIDTIVGILGDDWWVCDYDWNFGKWLQERESKSNRYPNCWMGTPGRDLPFLHLERRGGVRVRLELPAFLDAACRAPSPGGTPVTNHTLRVWLHSIRGGVRASTVDFNRHVTWLEPKHEKASCEKGSDASVPTRSRRTEVPPQDTHASVAQSSKERAESVEKRPAPSGSDAVLCDSTAVRELDERVLGFEFGRWLLNGHTPLDDRIAEVRRMQPPPPEPEPHPWESETATPGWEG